MVEENGGRLVARGARLDADARVTHVVFVDAASHSTPAATRATIEALPFACRGVVPGRAPPMLLAKTWLVESCKRHARGEPPAAFESHELSRDASNEGGGVRAPLATVQPDADALPARRGGGGATKSPRRSAIDDDDAVRVLDALTSAATARDLDASRDPHDLRSACVAATLREACASLREYRPNRRMTSRADFDRFASQGYPGFVGRTCAARDVVEDAMGATWDARDASDHDAAAAFAAAAATSKAGKRRRVRGEDRLSTLPPEVLRRCLDGLAMLDVLAAAATCRGLAAAALGDRLATTTAAAAAASPPWPSRRGGVGAVRALRVMTWNLKNNDPDPSRRFANQPGAGAKDGGWHWHSRAPLVSRVIQNEKPHVLCVQEDMLSMTREVFASREMRAASCLEYSCFPSPVGGERGADDRVLLEANDDYDGEPGAVSIEIAKLVRSKGRWEQCGVWWRRDTFDLIEAGQFEWVDGRFFAAYEACLERGGGGGGGGGGDATWTRKGKMGYGLDAHMIPMTWALLRLKDGEGGESGASGDEGRRFLCCSTHIESGHDWSSDVPAKIRSSKCIRAAVGRLQQKFGADVPLILAGDLNQQKVQQQYRQLTGEGRALWRGMTALAPPSNAEKGKGGGGRRRRRRVAVQLRPSRRVQRRGRPPPRPRGRVRRAGRRPTRRPVRTARLHVRRGANRPLRRPPRDDVARLERPSARADDLAVHGRGQPGREAPRAADARRRGGARGGGVGLVARSRRAIHDADARGVGTVGRGRRGRRRRRRREGRRRGRDVEASSRRGGAPETYRPHLRRARGRRPRRRAIGRATQGARRRRARRDGRQQRTSASPVGLVVVVVVGVVVVLVRVRVVRVARHAVRLRRRGRRGRERRPAVVAVGRGRVHVRRVRRLGERPLPGGGGSARELFERRAEAAVASRRAGSARTGRRREGGHGGRSRRSE